MEHPSPFALQSMSPPMQRLPGASFGGGSTGTARFGFDLRQSTNSKFCGRVAVVSRLSWLIGVLLVSCRSPVPGPCEHRIQVRRFRFLRRLEPSSLAQSQSTFSIRQVFPWWPISVQGPTGLRQKGSQVLIDNLHMFVSLPACYKGSIGLPSLVTQSGSSF